MAPKFLRDLLRRSGEIRPETEGDDLIKKRKAERAAAREGAAAGAHARPSVPPASPPPDARPEEEQVRHLPVLRRDHGPLARVQSVLQSLTDIPREVLDLITGQTAHEEEILPFRVDERGTVTAAVARFPSPDRQAALEALVRARAGHTARLRYEVVPRQDLVRLLLHHYPEYATNDLRSAGLAVVENLAGLTQTHPLVMDTGHEGEIYTFFRHLMTYAVRMGVQDLHIEVREDHTRIRMGIDGELRSPNLATPLQRDVSERINRVIKGMCVPALAPDRLQARQEGVFHIVIDTPEGPTRHYCRANFTPTNWGQECVIRLHKSDETLLDFDRNVTDPFTRNCILSAVREEMGVIYITSPVCNGKTTLAHAILRPPIVPETRKIYSIEHGIEIDSPYMSQHSVDEQNSDMDLLRSALRSDIDWLFFGEVRDEMTADAVQRAALTGHMILTTMHTPTTAYSVQRLLNYKLDRTNIANSSRLFIAQRLVKRACACAPVLSLPDKSHYRR